jgi:ferrous iron transport protein B
MIQATGIGIPALVSFIAFNMLTIPCFAAAATAKGEIRKGKFKWTLLFWVFTSYLVSTIVYTVGEWWWTAFIWVAIAVCTGVAIAVHNKKADAKKRLKK